MDFSSQLIKVLDDLGKRFGIAIDWSQQNIMPYAKELFERVIRYEIAMSSFTIIVCSLITWVLIKLCKNKKDEWDREDFSLNRTFSYIGIVALIVIILFQISDIITALILPEKIIIDMVQFYSILNK